MVIIKFSCVIILFPRCQLCSSRKQLFIDAQIPVGVAGMHLLMKNRSVAVNDLPGWRDAFVNRPDPSEFPRTLQDTFTEIGHCRRPVLGKCDVIGQHDNICCQVFLELSDCIGICHNIIRIEPHLIILRCFGESKITCGSKIIIPWIIENMRCKLRGDLFCTIC